MAKDLAWGQVLFIFLALPVVALALVLSRFAAESGSEATRRHAALLRARGASIRELMRVFLNAEGNPTVSLALTSFVAPLLLWIGGTLGLLRLIGFATSRSDRLAGILRRPLGAGGELADRSSAARAGPASRAIVLLALAFSCATSLRVFDATYRQQQHVDPP